MLIKTKKYAIATPYIIPDFLANKKVVNIGDGFIYSAIVRFLGHEPESVITSRQAPTEDEIRKINELDYLVLGGANQLNDGFSVFPGYQAKDLEKIKVPIIPFGIGIHGIEKENFGPKPNTVEILKEIHNRITASSWRCPLTTQYLQKHIPEISDKVMMTGCPVAYDRPILDLDRKIPLSSAIVAVTITDRGDFLNSESNILHEVKNNFPQSQLFLCLHQDMLPKVTSVLSKSLFVKCLDSQNKFIKVRALARDLGYSIIPFSTYQQAFQFYKTCDLHIGSRLHAHLYFLSQGKPSFLFGFDRRHEGIAKTYNIKIRNSGDFEMRNEEFEDVKKKIQSVYENMLLFRKKNRI